MKLPPLPQNLPSYPFLETAGDWNLNTTQKNFYLLDIWNVFKPRNSKFSLAGLFLLPLAFDLFPSWSRTRPVTGTGFPRLVHHHGVSSLCITASLWQKSLSAHWFWSSFKVLSAGWIVWHRAPGVCADLCNLPELYIHVCLYICMYIQCGFRPVNSNVHPHPC